MTAPRRLPEWFAFSWASIIAVALLSVPIYGGDSVNRTLGQNGTSTSMPDWFEGTVLDVAGAAALPFVLLPVIACLAVLATAQAVRHKVTIAASVAVSAVVLLGIMTLGLLHVPTAVALIVAATRGSAPATA